MTVTRAAKGRPASLARRTGHDVTNAAKRRWAVPFGSPPLSPQNVAEMLDVTETIRCGKEVGSAWAQIRVGKGISVQRAQHAPV